MNPRASSLSGSPKVEEVHAQDWMHCSETAKQVLARVDGYVNIGIASADGDLLCSGLPPLPDKNMRRQNFLEEMTPSGNLLLGRYHVGLITGNAVLMVAVPLPTSGGTVPLVAWANIDLQWLARHFADRFNSPNLTLLIADSRGTILVRLPDNAAWAGKPVGNQYSSLLNAPAEGVKDTIGIDGEERIIAYSPLAHRANGHLCRRRAFQGALYGAHRSKHILDGRSECRGLSLGDGGGVADRRSFDKASRRKTPARGAGLANGRLYRPCRAAEERFGDQQTRNCVRRDGGSRASAGPSATDR